ncbi:MAG TPA: hypothetical protein VHR45_13895 [Thermoanaerobaculia bacterium]|nr:hypothetical protein [Thermoanaerobaculia bacterium]
MRTHLGSRARPLLLFLAFGPGAAACAHPAGQWHSSSAEPVPAHTAPAPVQSPATTPSMATVQSPAPTPSMAPAPSPAPTPTMAAAHAPAIAPVPALGARTPASVDFGTQIQPMLEARCRPCHYPGGSVYDKLPFDRAATVVRLGEKLFTRIKDEDQRRTIREFLAQQAGTSRQDAKLPSH